MRVKSVILLSIFVFLWKPCCPASSLSSQGEIDEAFESSEVVLDAKVVSKVAIWTMGGELTSEDVVRQTHADILKFVESLDERFGKEESLEKKKYVEEWEKTELGEKNSQSVECLTLVTLFPQRVVQGKFDAMDEPIYASWSYWSSGVFENSDEQANAKTNAGSTVRLFLKPGWKERVGVIPIGSKRLLIGSTKMKPTVSLETARKMVVGEWKTQEKQLMKTAKGIVLVVGEETVITKKEGKEILRGKYAIIGKGDGMLRLQCYDVKSDIRRDSKSQDTDIADKTEGADAYVLITELSDSHMSLIPSHKNWEAMAKTVSVRFQRRKE